MKGFSNFLIEAEEKKKEELQTDQRRVSDDIVTTFGRFNPPHKGHLKAMDHADKLAGDIGDNARRLHRRRRKATLPHAPPHHGVKERVRLASGLSIQP
jgi:hypothetical protein